MIDSRCGLSCTGCEYKERCGCGGCIETEGRPFHGECPVAMCCQEKEYMHCGECAEMPCALLAQYSCDSEHGDNPPGARIERLRAWRKPGFSFAGVNIYSRQPERILDFYKKLGLCVKVQPEEKYFGAELALTAAENGPVIWIWSVAEDEDAPCRNHLVFTADGKLDRVYENIQAAGIECEPPKCAPWGGMELLLADPDGNEILFL